MMRVLTTLALLALGVLPALADQVSVGPNVAPIGGTLTNPTLSGTVNVTGSGPGAGNLNIGGTTGNSMTWSGVASNNFANSPFWVNTNWGGTSSISTASTLNQMLASDNLSLGSVAPLGQYASVLTIQDQIKASATGGRQTLTCLLGFSAAPTVVSNTNPFYGCGQFTVSAGFNVGGTSFASAATAVGHLFGASTIAHLQSGATFWNEIFSNEADVQLDSGSSAGFVEGVKSVNLGAVNGNYNMDTAFVVEGARWQYGLSLGYGAYQWPFASTGTGIMFWGPQSPATGQAKLAWGIDAINPVFSSGFYRTIGASVDGSGNATAQTGNFKNLQVTSSGGVGTIALAGELVTTVTISAAGTGAVPGDLVTDSISPHPGVYQVATTSVASGSVVSGGAGGANGACTVTGTTGTGTPFQLSGTVTGGALAGALTVSVAGSYTANPTTIANEPVTGCGLTGATVSVVMQVAAVTQLVQDVSASHLSAAVTSMTPINLTAVGGSSISGLSLALTSTTPNSLSVNSAGNHRIGMFIDAAAGAASNYIDIQDGSTGNSPVIKVDSGSVDTNSNLTLVGKGTGNVNFFINNHTISVPTPNATDTLASLGLSQTFTQEQLVNIASAGVALSLQNTSGTCTHTPGSSSETVSCSSDRKFKRDIRPAWWDVFAAWQLWSYPVREYVWKATGQHVIGVVAQEMQARHPEMVHEATAEDGSHFLTVDQPNIWVLVLAVQQLMAFAALSSLVAVGALAWHFWHHRKRAHLLARLEALEAAPKQ